MDLHLLSLGNLVTKAQSFMFMQQSIKIVRTINIVTQILFLRKLILPNDLHSLSILGEKMFLASSFLTFASNRFAMLHMSFYMQLRSGDSTESCF